jgi:hypothetical protein
MFASGAAVRVSPNQWAHKIEAKRINAQLTGG